MQCIPGPCSGHRKGTVIYRVARRVDGTSSVDVDLDRRRRRDSTSDVRCRVSARYDGAELSCSGKQEHINETGFSLEPSASEVLGRVALRVLRTPVEQQRRILIAADVAVFQILQLALSNSSPAY